MPSAPDPDWCLRRRFQARTASAYQEQNLAGADKCKSLPGYCFTIRRETVSLAEGILWRAVFQPGVNLRLSVRHADLAIGETRVPCGRKFTFNALTQLEGLRSSVGSTARSSAVSSRASGPF
jgi:hypothetical protein